MDIAQIIQKVKDLTRVTGIISGRSVKTEQGEIFVAFQVDCLSPDSSTPGVELSKRGESLSLKESRIAAYLLAMQTDIAAYEHALASGLITRQFCEDSIRSIKTRYSALLGNELKG